MLKKCVSVRLLKHRQERNDNNRPELAALLKKYDCTHNVLTAAYDNAKEFTPGCIYVDEYGAFRFQSPEHTRKTNMHGLAQRTKQVLGADSGPAKFEFEKITITPEQWSALADIAIHNRSKFAKAWEEMLSTATH